MQIGDVIARFKSDLSGFKDGIAEAKSSVSNFADNVQNLGKQATLVGGILTAAITLPVIGLGKAAITAADQQEQLTIAFKTMLGSAEKANAMIAQLQQFASKTPFTLEGINTSARQLLAYGITAQDLMGDLKNLGDIAAGVGMDKLPNLIMAFGQVNAATHLTGMELRQFTEAGVPLLQALSDTLKKPVKDIQAMVSAGEIGFTDVRNALASLTGEGGRFNDLMSKQMETAGGKFSNLEDQIHLTLVALGQELLPVVKQFVDLLLKLTQAFNTLSPQTKMFLMVLAALLAIVGPIIASVGALAMLATALGVGLLPLIGTIGLIVLAIGALVAVGILIIQNWETIKTKAIEIFTAIQTFVTGAFTAMGQAISDWYTGNIQPIMDAVGAVFTWLWESIIQPVIDFILGKFQQWYDFFSTVWYGFYQPLLEIVGMFFELIFLKIWHTIETVMNWIWGKITAIWNAIWGFLEPILNKIADFLQATWDKIVNAAGIAWEWVKTNIVTPVTQAWVKVESKISEMYDGITSKFNAVLQTVKDVWEKIKSAIVGPIQSAWDTVSGIIQKIHDGLRDALDLEKRHSPSIKDTLDKTVGYIKDALTGELGFGFSAPKHLIGVGAGAGGNIINISLAGANITDPTVAEQYAEMIGDQLIRKLSKTARTM